MAGVDLSPQHVRDLFAEGVDAFVALGRRAGVEDAWDRPACGVWSVGDVVRHELDVIGWYHAWLDRALAGDPTATFTADRLDAEAEAGVRRLADPADAAFVEPEVALDRFAAEATRYLERIPTHWDLPYGYPRGTVTVGLHAGIAVSEWHLHAWDVAGPLGVDHRPSDPAAVVLGATACFAAAPGRLTDKLTHAVAPLVVRRGAWERMLTTSGRTPRPSAA